MKKLIYTLLLLLVTFPAMAQSLFEQYERFLTEPRTYVCYRPDGKLKIDGKLNKRFPYLDYYSYICSGMGFSY
jgi:hypothetical protein